MLRLEEAAQLSQFAAVVLPEIPDLRQRHAAGTSCTYVAGCSL